MKIARDFDLNLEIDQDGLENLVAATHEEADKYGGRGIAERVRDLLLDDFVDLQAEGQRFARLIVREGRLKAV